MSGELRSYLEQLGSRRRLDLVARLQACRRERDERSLFFVEGVRNFLAAIDNSWPVEAVIYSDRLLKSGIARSKIRAIGRKNTLVCSVSPEDFRRASQARHASGVAALLAQRFDRLPDHPPREGPWLLVERLETSSNLGTMIRTASAVVANGLVLVGTSIDPFCPKLVRSSMGSIFGQRIVRTTASALRAWTRRHAVQVVGASPDAQRSMFDIDFDRSCMLALGHERHGLGRLSSLCSDLVRIPMLGSLDSLNVGVAGSLLLYEAARKKLARQGV